MKRKILTVLGTVLVTASLWAGPAAKAETLDSMPEIRQQLPNEWKQMEEVQKELKAEKAAFRKLAEELRVLTEQKRVKTDMTAVHSIMHKVHGLHEADKQMKEELKTAIQAKDEAKMKKIVTVLTTHKREKIKLFKEAQQLMQTEIQKLKKQ